MHLMSGWAYLATVRSDRNVFSATDVIRSASQSSLDNDWVFPREHCLRSDRAKTTGTREGWVKLGGGLRTGTATVPEECYDDRFAIFAWKG
jgi:hypothetical protein